jgi:ABC-type phosphate transport system substrate-binding protein
MRIASKRKKGLAAFAVGVLALGLLIPGGVANADEAPNAGDIVDVGSDTLQYMLDFGSDGDLGGDPGYNPSGLNRLISIDATPDANARAGYLNGSANGALLPLNPTVVLRAGSQPVERPNGSGAGLTAIEGDTGAIQKVQFTRSSSAIQASDVTTLDATLGHVHVLRLGHESLGVATATTTNAPALSNQQLFGIYTCETGFTHWNDSAIGGTSADTIVPIIPQAGSGTRKQFLLDIGFSSVDSNGNPTPALGGCVRTDEENNPYALYVTGDDPGNGTTDHGNITPIADPYATAAVASPDAIVPFSGARLDMYTKQHYFFNPNVQFGKAVPAGDQGVLSPGIVMAAATGTAHDGNPVYTDERGLYVVFRQSDITNPTHLNGLNKNWVQTLFLNPGGSTPFFQSGNAKADFESAGVSWDFADCGEDPQNGAASCGAFGPNDPNA